MIQRLIFLLLLTISFNVKAQDLELNLIPKPQSIELKKGTFKIDQNTTLYFESEFEIAGNFLNDFLQNGAGFQLKKLQKKRQILFS